MPSIDPAVLRRRTAALVEQFADPPAAISGVRALLDDYADRTHRSSPLVKGSLIDNQYKTPAPVLRAIARALRDPARDHPRVALAVAQGLWDGRSREERRIAAHLLEQAGPSLPDDTVALVETWARQIDSGATADVLAEHGLGPLIRANPAAFLERAGLWVTTPHKWVRRLGLAVLLPLVKDRFWDNVPGALEVLSPVMTDADGEVRRAAVMVLEHLAAKSPGEITRFLREQAVRSSGHAHWIIRRAMAALGPAEQAEIARLLRG